MRIIHVNPSLQEEASGPSYSVYRLCGALREAGHDATLATIGRVPPERTAAWVMPFAAGVGGARLSRSPALDRWLRRQARLSACDILHGHGMWQMPSLYPAWAAKRYRVPYICAPRGCFSAWAMEHGSRLKPVMWRLLLRPAVRDATCFHATSESECADIRRLGFRQPVAVIANGIDIPPLGVQAPSTHRTLLFLGRLHRVKGIVTLLEAWAELQHRFPDWRLRIVGNTSSQHGSKGYDDELRRTTQALGLQRVSFEGPLYGEAKFTAYRDADLYVLPSLSENFAMTVAESLAMGTPAVVSKGAPWSGLADHDAGWWVDIGREPLAAALAHAMGLPRERLEAMGARGRGWMAAEFGWPALADKMIRVYEWMLDPARPVPDCVFID